MKGKQELAKIEIKLSRSGECPGCKRTAPSAGSEELLDWHLSKGGLWWCRTCWSGSIASGRFQIGTVPMETQRNSRTTMPRHSMEPQRPPPRPVPQELECEAPPPEHSVYHPPQPKLQIGLRSLPWHRKFLLSPF